MNKKDKKKTKTVNYSSVDTVSITDEGVVISGAKPVRSSPNERLGVVGRLRRLFSSKSKKESSRFGSHKELSKSSMQLDTSMPFPGHGDSEVFVPFPGHGDLEVSFMPFPGRGREESLNHEETFAKQVFQQPSKAKSHIDLRNSYTQTGDSLGYVPETPKETPVCDFERNKDIPYSVPSLHVSLDGSKFDGILFLGRPGDGSGIVSSEVAIGMPGYCLEGEWKGGKFTGEVRPGGVSADLDLVPDTSYAFANLSKEFLAQELQKREREATEKARLKYANAGDCSHLHRVANALGEGQSDIEIDGPGDIVGGDIEVGASGPAENGRPDVDHVLRYSRRKDSPPSQVRGF